MFKEKFKCFTLDLATGWRAHNAKGDGKTCQDCEDLDGRVFELRDMSELEKVFPCGELESQSSFLPHVHPNCRCEIILMEIYGG
jgi:hypothetical protein